MTDNYQFDKNSKLFQKFLSLKANKKSESSVEKNQNHNKSAIILNKKKQKINEQNSNKSFMNQQPIKKTNVHVTLDDIQQAASIVDQKYYNLPKKYEQKSIQQQKKQNIIQVNETVKIQNENEREVNISFDQKRQRKTREFGSKPRIRNQQKQNIQKSFINEDESGCNINNSKNKQSQMIIQKKQIKIKQKQNMFENIQKTQPVKIDACFSFGNKDIELKKKYQSLSQKYQQLKDTIQIQRKQRQLYISDKQSQLQLIKQKYFQLRSNEDYLTSQLKRMKQKYQAENMYRNKYEQEVKQLNLRIIELQQTLQNRDNILRKKNEEVINLKNYNDLLKQQKKQILIQKQRIQDALQMIQSQSKISKKDISIKQNLAEQLRRKLNNLYQQNNIAKDQIYKLTIKLYQLEQQNSILKGQLNRREKQMPQHAVAIQQKYMKSIETFSPKKIQNLNKQNDYIQQKGPRDRQFKPRKRQFGPNSNKNDKIQRPERDHKPIQNTQMKMNKEKAQRIMYLQAELQKIQQMKAMNGKIRKQKIQIERQLQQLHLQQ